MARAAIKVFPTLPTRARAKPRTAFGRWLAAGSEGGAPHETRPWWMVLWLTGVDYFSTLGYQPGIALLAAGALSPLATLVLVLVTLFGALPIYSAVALRSYAGQGSIALLENLLTGWRGKLLVLVLLGFAATDFVITMTLSAADAVQHILENPFVHGHLSESARVPLTILLLLLLALVFFKGFSEAIGLAALVAVPFLLITLVSLARGAYEILLQPELFTRWREGLLLDHSAMGLVFASLLAFPKLALGLSGFETGVSVMPLVRGDDGHGGVPLERIRGTRRLLLAAAVIMSVFLVASSLVTTLLIEPAAYQKGGDAYGRAIAYLTHRYLGSVVGTAYDVATIAILWFAGASAMAGLLNLIPRYLPRFGMAPSWVAHRRPLVALLLVLDVLVTLAFAADVEAQGGAYATGVLVLMLSAAVAVSIAAWRDAPQSEQPAALRRLSVIFAVIAVVFAYTLVDNIILRPDGLVVASCFIALVVFLGALSRYLRSRELRAHELGFADVASFELWQGMLGKKVNLVPLKNADPEARWRKAREIRQHYQVQGPLAFVHVELMDNRSEFFAEPCLHITRDGEDLVVQVTGAIAIANVLAYLSELIDPIRIFLGLTRQNAVAQSVRYLLWGEGETGLLVYQILVDYWAWTPEDDVRPLIFLMSE